MNFDISLNLKNEFTKNLKIEELARFVLAKEFKFGQYNKVEVSINFVDKDYIHNLNNQYRGIDTPTDVLSFECDGSSIGEIKESSFSEKSKSNSLFELGDIFICIDVAKENSNKFNTTLDNEIRLLVVHGLLHLCGYDHIKDNEAKIMESKEEELLDLWEKHV